MTDSDKVEVYLARYSNGVRLNEFTAPPGTLKHPVDPNESYVEATTGERFKIVVNLLPGFKFLGSPKVRVEFHVDQGSYIWDTFSKVKDRSASPSDRSHRCLLYTSDAAAEEDSVDLGGRRIIKCPSTSVLVRDDAHLLQPCPYLILTQDLLLSIRPWQSIYQLESRTLCGQEQLEHSSSEFCVFIQS